MLAHYPEATRCCARHGEFTSREYLRGRWSGCPTCTGEEEIARMADERRQHEARVRARLIGASGLEGRGAEATFENFDCSSTEQSAVLQVCRNFVETFQDPSSRPLWLIGPPGTGKTHLGCAMVREVISRHLVPASIASARGIVRRLRATWRRPAPESEDAVLQELGKSAHLLVLDEVGLGFGTEADQTQLFDVIDLRYNNRRPTILLSNHTAPEIRTSIGDRLFDRLREGAKVLVCNWPSHRRTEPSA